MIGLNHFLHFLGNFTRFISHTLHSHWPIFTTLGKIMNPQHFGSNTEDIGIRIRINPEIWIRIPDHFRLRLDALAEVFSLQSLSTV